jgi:hypothetical protein
MSEHDLSARVVTHEAVMRGVDTGGTARTMHTVLGYDPGDPYAITITFRTRAGDVVWTFARELLTRGLTDPSGEGDVHIWPSLDTVGRAMVIIELCSPDGDLVAQARTQDIYHFVSRSLAAVPAGEESDFLDLDQLIDQVLRSAPQRPSPDDRSDALPE